MAQIKLNGILLDIQHKAEHEILGGFVNKKQLFDYIDLDSTGIFLNNEDRLATSNQTPQIEPSENLSGSDITIHSIVGGG